MQVALVGLTLSRLALLSLLISVVHHPVEAFRVLLFAVVAMARATYQAVVMVVDPLDRVGMAAYPSLLLLVVH